MSQNKDVSADGNAKLVAAWTGLALTIFAVLGFAFAPGLELVWAVLLIWGLVTVGQVVIWREPAREEATEQPPRRRR